MGNSICFEGEEFYFKFTYTVDKKASNIYNISKYIQWTEFTTPTYQAHLGKILFTDISDHVIFLFGFPIKSYKLLKDDQELSSIKKFVDDEIVKGDEETVFDINITGNGFDIYKEEINIFFSKFLKKYVFHKQKHIKCLVEGLRFLRDIPTKQFFYSIAPRSVLELNTIRPEDCTPEKKIYKNFPDNKEDFMVVNIRSGVSYYQVNDEGKFERVSGSIIGESTFATLIRMLAGYENLMEALDEGMKGDFSTVDMTVGDIYGGGCADLGLPQDLIASSMGKAQYIKQEDKEKVPPRDLARSILVMFCINIGLMTNLVADSSGVKTIVVQGFPHLGFQTLLSTVFAVYDKKQKELLFLDNVEYVGCLGMNLILKEMTENMLDT